MGLVVALAGSFGSLALVLYGISQMRYELCHDALCVMCGPWCLRRILYSDMVSVERGAPLWNEHWNRLAPDPNITIRRRSGLIPNFVINPPDTDRFIADLRSRLK